MERTSRVDEIEDGQRPGRRGRARMFLFSTELTCSLEARTLRLRPALWLHLVDARATHILNK
jgi:hypothetical protein